MVEFSERHEFLVKQGSKLFSERSPLMSLWQDIGDNFYPERAHFTISPSSGEEFADHLTTSYPIIARRELGNIFGSMLRPDTPWFFVKPARGDDDLSNDAKIWLEEATQIQRRAMYDKDSGFVRATKEADHDFAAWGQAVLTTELNRNADGFLYRGWHLRDVAWADAVNGKVGDVHRKWTAHYRDLVKTFGEGNVHETIRQKYKDEPFQTALCRHIVVRAEDYEGNWRTPYVQIYLDLANKHVMQEVGSWTPIYTIPRWQTVSGSQYAYSPATVAALPDARLIQAMTLTLLEAGQKSVDPPSIATEEVVRSDIDLRAGGVTWVDSEYDERLGDALKPLNVDGSGLGFGVEMHDRVRVAITEAFYLNKVSMPPPQTGDMTAFEVGQRIQEYVRSALPIFQPVETDYNAEICEQTFELGMRNGLFGAFRDIPDDLSEQDTEFRFESPLSRLAERSKGQDFLESKGLLAAAAELDPGAAHMLDARTALRDSLDGIGTPADWLRSDDDIDARVQQDSEQAQAQALLGAAQQGADIASTLGEAGKSFAEADETITGEAA